MSYVWLNGYSTSLNARLSSKDRLLPIDDAKALAEKLGDGHSYLLINDGTGAEIVKAVSFGTEVKIECGIDGTGAKAFPAGACVKWEFNKAAFDDLGCPSEEKNGCCCGE
ncbi:hypothetical protein [Caviibacterium pharyngocola]|uniref:Uncharacterized protein n=1 Tax=Caviibacterium pharyngocola TaxID=28159 RepID=A0A2M8RXY6_9PAST|nr:hypothetical protein [Caviibacterium pharyngocola]PJG83750.1 hypothetical protein CVP04_02510 [Caviibacterium pharyngocola]